MFPRCRPTAPRRRSRITTLVAVFAAVLVAPALTAPAATADVVLHCETTLHTAHCAGETPLIEGDLECTSPGLITSLAGIITVARASCTATGSTSLVTGDGELTASTVLVDTTTGTVMILNGHADFTLTQPQTGSSASVTCDGSVLVLTTVPLALQTPLGTCDGDLTVNLPGGGTAQASMVCTGSVTLTATPFALLIPSGSCVGDMTVDVPGVGTMHITADNPTITFTTVPVPVLTVTSPNLTAQFTPAGGGGTRTTHCSAVTIDFSLVPVLPIPPALCTIT